MEGLGGLIPACKVPRASKTPVIKDYTVKYIMGTLIRFKVYSLIKGFWSFWVLGLDGGDLSRRLSRDRHLASKKGLRLSGFGFRFSGLGLRFSGLGLRLSGLGPLGTLDSPG